MLYGALYMQRLGFDGLTVKGQRIGVAEALERAGLLHYVGMGEECDGDGFTIGTREWPIYEITKAGMLALDRKARA